VQELKRKENENEEQYIWRVAQLKDNGLIDLDWDELAEYINRECRDDESEYRSSSAYRKPYQQAKRYYESGVFSKFNEDEYTNKLNEQKRELEKAKVAYRDERNDWNRQNRIEARIEAKLDNLGETLKEIGRSKFEVDEHISVNCGDNSLIVMLSDLHTGQTFNSLFGQYNTDILKDRMTQLLNKVISIGNRHNSVMVNVVLLGDQISGNIHNTIQVSNRENVIEQIKIASEVITWFCVELSKVFGYVHIYECAGNHSRLVSNKELAVHDERLDNLITWIIKQMTAHIDRIKVHDDEETRIDSGISMFELYGKDYVAVHGDYDVLNKTGVGNLSMMLGKIPYAIMNGHNHFPSNTDINGVKIIQGGSIAGSGDDYTIEKRLSGKPNQTVLVCDENGIDCIYNVELK
jgi:hypothetical protein